MAFKRITKNSTWQELGWSKPPQSSKELKIAEKAEGEKKKSRAREMERKSDSDERSGVFGFYNQSSKSFWEGLKGIYWYTGILRFYEP